MNEKLTVHTRRGQATSLRAYIVDQNNQPIASGGVKYRIQEQFYPFEAKREESVSDVFVRLSSILPSGIQASKVQKALTLSCPI